MRGAGARERDGEVGLRSAGEVETSGSSLRSETGVFRSGRCGALYWGAMWVRVKEVGARERIAVFLAPPGNAERCGHGCASSTGFADEDLEAHIKCAKRTQFCSDAGL